MPNSGNKLHGDFRHSPLVPELSFLNELIHNPSSERKQILVTGFLWVQWVYNSLTWKGY